MAVRWCSARPGHVVADVCCGSGDIALRLAQVVGKKGRVYGIDFATEQLEYARKKERNSWTPTSRRADVVWMQGDALELPFEEATFDAATCGYGLRNLTDHSRGIQELHRVLKPGGKVAVLDFNHSEDRGVDELQTFLLERIVVPAASTLGVSSEYEYIKESIRSYPTGIRLKQMAMEAGFRKASYYQLGFGLMGCLVAQK